MATIEQAPIQRGPGIKSTAEIAFGSLSRNFTWDEEQKREAFSSTVGTETKLPINTEDELLPETMRIIKEKNLDQLPIDYSKSYWNPTQEMNSLDTITYLGQYTSAHNKELPHSIMPPEEDVRDVIDEVLSSDKRLTIPELLKIGLDKSGNNIVGASLLLSWATRIGARGLDERAYPGIKFGPEEIKEWESHIAQFEVFDDEGRMDAAGDNYYFFEHLSGALVFRSIGGRTAMGMDTVLNKGTEIMKFVRKNVAKRPIMTPHHEASILGRNIGLTIAEEIELNNS